MKKRPPPKYTRSQVEDTLELVRMGSSSGVAGRIMGVPRATVDSWIRRYTDGVASLRRKRKRVRL